MNNKTTLITGGANGIGYETAKVFLQRGYQVAIIDRDSAIKERVIKELSVYGPINYIVFDLSDTIEIEDAVNKAIEPFGCLDVLVNNAGIGGHGDIFDITAEQWNQHMKIGLASMFFVAQAAGKHLIKNDRPGAIVNLSSIRATHADGTHMLYATEKAGIGAMTRELAVALGKHRIRVNSVLPGFVATNMTQHGYYEDPKAQNVLLAHMATPDMVQAADVARVIYFLASDDSAAITGQNIPVDAGMSIIAPGSEAAR